MENEVKTMDLRHVYYESGNLTVDKIQQRVERWNPEYPLNRYSVWVDIPTVSKEQVK